MQILNNFNFWGGGSTGWIIPFLFVLSIVVFFHELGHFLVARWCGVRVLIFSIGFGPELFGFNDRRGTRWKVSAIPLGGYVKFFGDDNAASVPDQDAIAQMNEGERRESFFHRSIAVRAAIVAAGPIANFMLAIIIFGMLALLFGKQVTVPRLDSVTPDSVAATAGFKVGDVVVSIDGRTVDGFADVQRMVAMSARRPLEFVIDRARQNVRLTVTPELRQERERFGNQAIGVLDIGGPIMPARVSQVQPGTAADLAGIEPGDLVRSIDGKPVASFSDIRDIVSANPERQLDIVVERAGRTVQLKATPLARDEKDASGAIRRIGLLGISGAFDPADVKSIKYGPLDAIAFGVSDTWFLVERTLAYIGGVVVGRESADQLGGPIRIAQVSSQMATLGFIPIIQLAAIISVSIGLLNLFPIPLLDGGHLLFYGIEAVRGRPLSERAQELGFRIGLALVLMLMIFATWNDLNLRRLFS